MFYADTLCTVRCPNNRCKNQENQSKRFGYYRRKSDSKIIQRYYCKNCKKSYSAAQNDPAYHHNKRRINYPLKKLLAFCVSQRRAALILSVSRKTIARKLIYLGSYCKDIQAEFLKEYEAKVHHFQFDELITSEHTKCKPLGVAVAVSVEDRKILGFEVSSMPAAGHLSKISRKKYGQRPDNRKKGLNNLFKKISKSISKNVKIQSDAHPNYFPLVQKHFPDAIYQQSMGEKATITGQGELKKNARDPLFCINHTLAMLRANVNRLVRKTWCTTKNPVRLADHLAIYVSVHNKILTARV